jgi:hypothetical protein
MHAALVCDLHDGFVSSKFFSLISRVNTVAPLKEKNSRNSPLKIQQCFFLEVAGIRIPASAPPRPTAAGERQTSHGTHGQGLRGWPTQIARTGTAASPAGPARDAWARRGAM